MFDVTLPRRRVIAAATGALLGVTAGCVGGGSDGDAAGSTATAGTAGTEATVTDDGSTETATDDGSAETGTNGADLDLREANVVDVAVEPDGDAYDFDVTLHHDDDGEDGYANWWQVERLDGDQLGRRELLHAHSQQPFTRSATVEIPDSVECVVVRGHDQTHGYGGRLAVVDLGSGATNAVDQGAEPQSVNADACPGG